MEIWTVAHLAPPPLKLSYLAELCYFDMGHGKKKWLKCLIIKHFFLLCPKTKIQVLKTRVQSRNLIRDPMAPCINSYNKILDPSHRRKPTVRFLRWIRSMPDWC